MFLAHIRVEEDCETTQTVKEHVEGTAHYTAQNLANVKLYHVGYVAGLLHDMGKTKKEYLDYIMAAAHGEPVRKGSVNHTFAGVAWLWKKYHNEHNLDREKDACEIIAYAIGAHHGNFDLVSWDGADGMRHRIETCLNIVEADAHDIHYEESVSNFLSECVKEQEIEQNFAQAVNEIENFIIKISNENRHVFQKETEIYFAIGLLVRLVTSALIDGDRRDTAKFMMDTAYPEQKSLTAVWEQELLFMEEKMSRFEESEINLVRTEISNQCKSFAKRGGGVYSLNVPTGAGKTLSTLRYALAHAMESEKDRIFFFLPLLSIIEQNAKVISEYLSNDKLLFEHHSNVFRMEETKEETNRYELLSSCWKAEIIVSSLVQFLYALFAGKTTAMRRFHALCNSIIIIDEVQSIPHNMISLVNMAINFLAYCCNATVILCSATQPCFETVKHPLVFPNQCEMVPYKKEIWEKFKRTQIKNECRMQGYTLDEIADFSMHIMEKENSLLVICNTKKEACELYEKMKGKALECLETFHVFHLSTAECKQHRFDVLKTVKERLGKERTVLISTQCIEAGVDISFESVIRFLAGLDNIAQAAGRCNRNGEFNKICNVYVVNILQEKLTHLQEIVTAQHCMRAFLELFENNREQYEDDMLSNQAINLYFKKLFSAQEVKNEMDFPVQKMDSTIFDMLAINKVFTNNARTEPCSCLVRQAFKTAGEEFHVFDDSSVEVIVPYNEEAESVIADLYSERALHDVHFLKACLEKAKPYTISLFQYQISQLEKMGGLHTSAEDKKYPYNTLLKSFYNSETGFGFANFI